MPLLELTRKRAEGDELRLTLEPLVRLAVIGLSHAEQEEIALGAAGLLPEGLSHTGTLVLAGRPYPETEQALGSWRGKRIGYLGPHAPFGADLSVRRFVALALGAEVALPSVLERSGLDPAQADQPVALLAPFAHQSLLLTLAQWQEPELLVCLEPARGLSAEDSRRLLSRISSGDRAVLLFTSNGDAARALDGEIAVIHHGRLVERGPHHRMTTAGQHEATRRLLVPERRGNWRSRRPKPGPMLLEARGIITPVYPGAPLDLALSQGETLGILGETRSGKTGLLRVLAGLAPTEAGALRIDNVSPNPRHLPFTARAGIAFIPADLRAAFNPDLTVGLTLTEPMRVEHQLVVEEQADRLVEAMLTVGLAPERLEHRPAQFSALELQRLALARAMIGRPRLLIADAPTEGLDPHEAAELMRLIERLRVDFNLTMVIASRDFAHLDRLADRIIVLSEGMVVEEGTPDALRDAPAHPVTRRLLGPQPAESG